MTRVLVALLAFLSVQAAFAQTVWTAATEYPATAVPGQGLTTFATLVAEKTGGALVVRPSFDAALGIRSAGMPVAVRDGRVQVGDAFGGALAGTDPLFALSSLPFLATSIEDARRLAALARPAYEAALARIGQRLLYTTPWPPTGLWSTTRLTDPAALARLRVRTYDDTSRDVMAALGATATTLSFADAMPKLADGSVDAVLSSGDGGAGRRLFEHLRVFTEIGYAQPISIATVSEAALGALPPEQRAAILAAGAETEARQWEAIATRQAENHRQLDRNGVAIDLDPPPAVRQALARAAAPVLERWVASAGPDAALLIARYRAGAP